MWHRIVEDGEHRKIVVQAYGHETVGAFRVYALAVAPVNYDLNGEIRDWAVYIGPAYSGMASGGTGFGDREMVERMAGAVASSGMKTTKAVGTAMFPSLPSDKWRL